MRFTLHRSRQLILLAVLIEGGCKTKLMPTPAIYTTGQYALFDELPETLQSSKIDVLYVTDRVPKTRKDGSLTYTFDRSPSVAFG